MSSSSSRNPTSSPARAVDEADTVRDLDGEDWWESLAILCEACRKAHGIQLSDAVDKAGLGGPGHRWEEDVSDDEEPRPHVCLGEPFRTELLADMWPGLPRLLDSARAGCKFCAFLRDAVLSDDVKDLWSHMNGGSVGVLLQTTRLQIAIRYMTWHKSLDSETSLSAGAPEYVLDSLEVSLESIDLPVIFLHFRLEAATGSSAVAHWLGLRPSTIRDYGREDVTAFLRTQLQQHKNDEEDVLNETPFCPERLIDVRANPPCLVERKDVVVGPTEQLQYAALSYCWGPPEDSKRQTKNTKMYRDPFSKAIGLADLSPVLTDAVKVTRNLSVPYLWVDSLCILQDDISDWQRQCSQMNEIYGKAYVTLITAASRSCLEGFLQSEKPRLQFPYRSMRYPHIRGSFIMDFTHASTDPVCARMYDSMRCAQDRLEDDLTYCQWARRGWTFQEGVMSGARILFGKDGVYFGSKDTYVSTSGVTLPNMLSPTIPSYRDVMDQNTMHEAWDDILMSYSRFTSSSFTNPGDLLPALSGLARVFGTQLSAQYVAGHWADRSLHHTLLWEQSGSTRTAKLPLQNKTIIRPHDIPFLVPTWSCLGRGHINFPTLEGSSQVTVLPKRGKPVGDEEKQLYGATTSKQVKSCSRIDYDRSEIAIVGVQSRPVGEDPYGAIKGASLTLEGFLLDLESLCWSESTWLGKGRRTGSLPGNGAGRGDEIVFHDHGARHVGRDFHFDMMDTDGRQQYVMRLDFDEEAGYRTVGNLISQMKMFLVAKDEFGWGEQGYGLMLTNLFPEGRVLDFVRVGMFMPAAFERLGDTLQSMKRLMKKETITLY